MIFNNNNRYFSSVGNGNHWGPNAGYTWSQNAVVTGVNGQTVSGAWIPSQSDVNGALLVNTNNASNAFNKISSVGYVSGFSLPSSAIVKGIQGYSRCTLNGGEGFIQIYDGATLIEPVTVVSGNNWFVDLAENGVNFNNLIIQNSSDPVLNQQYASADFFCVVIYK